MAWLGLSEVRSQPGKCSAGSRGQGVGGARMTQGLGCRDSGEKAGACDLCYHLVQEFYIWECINHWWDNLFFSYFGLNYIHLYIPTFFVHPRRKWNWAGQFRFARHTLGAAYAAWQLHSRTPEWMSLTCEKRPRCHLSSVIWRAKGKLHTLPTHVFCQPAIVPETSLLFPAQVYRTEILVKHKFYLKGVM